MWAPIQSADARHRTTDLNQLAWDLTPRLLHPSTPCLSDRSSITTSPSRGRSIATTTRRMPTALGSAADPGSLFKVGLARLGFVAPQSSVPGWAPSPTEIATWGDGPEDGEQGTGDSLSPGQRIARLAAGAVETSFFRSDVQLPAAALQVDGRWGRERKKGNAKVASRVDCPSCFLA